MKSSSAVRKIVWLKVFDGVTETFVFCTATSMGGRYRSPHR
ncbi:hypothetical protein ACIHDR_04625 [Nocardia sp. NPDC052278]